MSDVLDRFLRYVAVDSESDPDNADEVPSAPREHVMARLLADELEAIGLDDVSCDEHAYVTASLPASAGAEGLPALGLIAHFDSAHDVCALGVKPQVITYEGGDLVIRDEPDGRVAVSPAECPELEGLAGQDIVCSDGTTLLSADDKAGVAEIAALVARLKKDPTLAHPALKVAFVPDEEIGHGASLLDLDAFGATWAYTVDGGALGEVAYETFNAVEAKVDVNGKVVHPGHAKDLMVNAITVAREFDALLPEWERPEHTEGYEGYFHAIREEGTSEHVRIDYILRDFFDDGIEARRQAMLDAAAFLDSRYGEGTVEVALRDEYRNMASALKGCMFLVDNALAANRACGVEPFVQEVRGGTDGSQLSLRGLPCPNLATGGFLCHSQREFIPVSSLERQVDVLQELVALFAVPQA
ncbi:MAG: peptidase T [Atopobiaceae bacterium]|jgi:tripeptide aminopeptidase|nr:peptidase T [Atopobiaceae bacterium]MCH4119671.1 peptidase T [Atopobiaceae bacterium]MCI1318906.1 peptidase T [Atopobiaceae bacterium]MCI1388742.1 peptidase T [Atopobiaceae bacterium]MCI1432638.1 peptidase T [Atopobiaceae bacterium]